MSDQVTPQEIATAIVANCDAYRDDQIDYDTWAAAQNRLWRAAMNRAMGAEVMRLVCPSLGAKHV